MFFYYLSGIVSDLEQNTAVIDCNGIGFECSVSSYTQSQLKLGDKVKLFTECSLKENAFEIFGFSTKEEKFCFNLLLSVNGVGPKAALSILSVCSPSQFRLAVAGGDEKMLTRASGVGKKVAQRILLELKDKISVQADDVSSYNVISTPSNTVAQNEAVAALSTLGFTQNDISHALKGIPTDSLKTEEIIRLALRAMTPKA